MSILTQPYKAIGYIEPDDGFFRVVDQHHEWISDPFTVEYSIDEDDRLIFTVSFSTLTGAITMEWDLISLHYLARPKVLTDTLLAQGIRVSAVPGVAAVIINAIQRPDLMHIP